MKTLKRIYAFMECVTRVTNVIIGFADLIVLPFIGVYYFKTIYKETSKLPKMIDEEN